MTSDGPPAGWNAIDGALRPGVRVADYAARDQPTFGSCTSYGCKRSVKLDPKDMCGEGMGRLSMAAVQNLHRCNRMTGCGLSFRDGDMADEPCLSQFEGRPFVRVRLKCEADRCKFYRVWRVEEMIAGLIKRGKGNGFTRIGQLARLMTEPCPVCKKVRWGSDILWANTTTAGWRAAGEKLFDERARWERA